MHARFCFFIFLILLCACKEAVFTAGIDNRLIALIDRKPEAFDAKIQFTSDESGDGCSNHDEFKIESTDDGTGYYKITIEAKDYYRKENNCNDYNPNKPLRHKIRITAYVPKIEEQMYIQSSTFLDHPNYPTSNIQAYYKLIKDEDDQGNNGYGIKYYGYNVELEIIDLNLEEGFATGTLNATLYRETNVNDPGAFVGVDNLPNLQLFDPSTFIEDLDQDGQLDWHLTDSIRIEDCIFQRITVNDDR